jgi:hypothetical protein
MTANPTNDLCNFIVPCRDEDGPDISLNSSAPDVYNHRMPIDVGQGLAP